MNRKHEAEKLARAQDRMARVGFKAIRRELLKAANASADAYAARGVAVMPDEFFKHMVDVIGNLQGDVSMMAVTRQRRLIEKVKGEGKFDWPMLALRFFEEYSAAHMANKITRIAETQRKRINATIAQGVNEAATRADIAKRIKASAKVFTSYDAARIARTEVHGMFGYATAKTSETFADANVFVQTWVSVDDERTRESHQEADGQQREIGEAFSVGGENLMYPGDPAGSAGNVINCRCVVINELRDDV